MNKRTKVKKEKNNLMYDKQNGRLHTYIYIYEKEEEETTTDTTINEQKINE